MSLKKFSLAAVGVGVVAILLVYAIMSWKQEKFVLDEATRKLAPGKFVELKYGPVHYRLDGPDSGRLVLLIPGGGISGIESFENTIPGLNDRGYRTLTYDLYGRGYSARPAVENRPELFLEQLMSLLDTLGIRDTMHVVSMSMGALIATDFATTYPDRVGKLVFIDPSLAGEFKMNPALKVPIVSDLLMTMYWYPRAKENQRKEFVNQDVFEKYSQRLEYFMQFEGYKATNYSTWMHMLTVNKLPQLKEIASNKILLIYGDKDPYFPVPRNTERIQEHYPTLQVKVIENAGHIPHLEKPKEANAYLLEFFQD